MLTRAIKGLIVETCMFWFVTTDAAAGWLSFTNHSSKTIYLAVAVPADCSDGWATIGWNAIPPGQWWLILPVIEYDFYYFYATDGDIYWGGDADGCVDFGHGQFFQCSNCPPEFTRVTMQKIDTPGYHNYNVPLRP